MSNSLNRYLILTLSIIVLWTDAGCTTDTSTQIDNNSIAEKSELALLMRVMEKHGDEVRKALNTGEALPSRPEGIALLLTAEPTPEMHIDQQTFPVFVSQYLDGVDALYLAAAQDQEHAYNAIIQSCSNCHTINCPGPLMKIEKMFINHH